MTVETLIHQKKSEQIEKLAEECHIPSLLVSLLSYRGISTKEEIQSFLNPQIDVFHSPFLLPDIEKGIERIQRAIEQKEKTVIYGDYDVDGISSTATLYYYLKKRGLEASYHIPNRLTEGYGLNMEAVKQLATEQNTLMITVDTGITAENEIRYAKELGMETVVTDHHECVGTLPESAVAIINPMREDAKYPFKGLAGVGVIFKVICALEYSRRKNEKEADVYKEMFSSYGDLVTLGTIADVMPMVDENRYIVKTGLYRVAHSEKPGLHALVEEVLEKSRKKEVTATTVGFQLAPRINAAGRMGNADRALELFLTENYGEGVALSEELSSFNAERQSEELRIFTEAEELLAAGECENLPFILLGKENWHHGVIGIVCSRLTEKYRKPTILLAFEDSIGKGSGRSIKGVNLVALLEKSKDLLLKFGGHEMAAGLTCKVENVEKLKERILENYSIEDVGEPVLTADMELDSNELTLPFASSLTLLEPTGTDNGKPLFYTTEMRVDDIIPLSGGKHIKLLLEKDRLTHQALYFGKSPSAFPYKIGDTVNVLYNLNVNDFMNREEVQIQIKEVLPSENGAFKTNKMLQRYNEIREGCPFYEEENLLPCRSDFVNVYLLLKELSKAGQSTCSGAFISEQIASIGPVKYRLILDILKEEALLEYKENENEPFVFTFSLVKGKKEKVNLENSPMLQKLRQQLQ